MNKPKVSNSPSKRKVSQGSIGDSMGSLMRAKKKIKKSSYKLMRDGK